MSERDEDIVALRELTDGEFSEVVLGSLEAPDDWAVLIDPDIVERTIAALSELRSKAVEAENLAHHRLHAAAAVRRYVPGLKDKVASTSLHRRQLDGRYHQARKVQRSMRAEQHAVRAAAKQAKQAAMPHVRALEAKSAAHRAAVRRLTLAIQEHRLAAVSDGLTPEPADRRLWALLDLVEVPLGDGMATLTEMLGSGSWTADDVADGERGGA